MIRRRSAGCACGSDLPGTCPGLYNCPYSGYEPPDLDDDDDDDDDIDVICDEVYE